MVLNFLKVRAMKLHFILRAHVKLHLGVYRETLYDIMHVKNALLKSVYHIKESSTCSLLTVETGYVYCPVRTVKIQSRPERLRWSRGNVLAFSTQVRGLKPGRSRRIFKGEKIVSTPSFGGEVKPSVPCRRFTACKRTLKCNVELDILGKITG